MGFIFFMIIKMMLHIIMLCLIKINIANKNLLQTNYIIVTIELKMFFLFIYVPF